MAFEFGNPGLGYLQSYVKGFEDYSQQGTNIPSLRMQDKYAQESGGPLFGQTSISANPSFDVVPDIDSPIVDRWIQESKAQNPVTKPGPTMEELRRRMPAIRSRLGIGPA